MLSTTFTPLNCRRVGPRPARSGGRLYPEKCPLRGSSSRAESRRVLPPVPRGTRLCRRGPHPKHWVPASDLGGVAREEVHPSHWLRLPRGGRSERAPVPDPTAPPHRGSWGRRSSLGGGGGGRACWEKPRLGGHGGTGEAAA